MTQPEAAQQALEPVAWMVYTVDGKSVCVTDNPADFSEGHRALPLYTAPPRCPNCASLEEQNTELDAILARLADTERKPLTEGVLMGVYIDFDRTADPAWSGVEYLLRLCRAIERAHGIGTERPATLTKPCGSLGEDVSLCRYPDCAGGQAGTICNKWCPACPR